MTGDTASWASTAAASVSGGISVSVLGCFMAVYGSELSCPRATLRRCEGVRPWDVGNFPKAARCSDFERLTPIETYGRSYERDMMNTV